MLEILGVITLAYLAFGALLSFSPLMRDVFCIEFSSRNPADKWKIRVARMIGHIGMMLAWPGLLAGAHQSVIVPSKDLIRAIRRTLHSYWQPNTVVRFALTLRKEAEMGVKSFVRPASTRSFASSASQNTPKVNPSEGDKRTPQERVFYKEWKVATLAAELGVQPELLRVFALRRSIGWDEDLPPLEAAGLVLDWVAKRPGLGQGPIVEAAGALLDAVTEAPTE
jgi:hypothetical protein